MNRGGGSQATRFFPWLAAFLFLTAFRAYAWDSSPLSESTTRNLTRPPAALRERKITPPAERKPSDLPKPAREPRITDPQKHPRPLPEVKKPPLPQKPAEGPGRDVRHRYKDKNRAVWAYAEAHKHQAPELIEALEACTDERGDIGEAEWTIEKHARDHYGTGVKELMRMVAENKRPVVDADLPFTSSSVTHKPTDTHMALTEIDAGIISGNTTKEIDKNKYLTLSDELNRGVDAIIDDNKPWKDADFFNYHIDENKLNAYAVNAALGAGIGAGTSAWGQEFTWQTSSASVYHTVGFRVYDAALPTRVDGTPGVFDSGYFFMDLAHPQSPANTQMLNFNDWEIYAYNHMEREAFLPSNPFKRVEFTPYLYEFEDQLLPVNVAREFAGGELVKTIYSIPYTPAFTHEFIRPALNTATLNIPSQVFLDDLTAVDIPLNAFPGAVNLNADVLMGNLRSQILSPYALTPYSSSAAKISAAGIGNVLGAELGLSKLIDKFSLFSMEIKPSQKLNRDFVFRFKPSLKQTSLDFSHIIPAAGSFKPPAFKIKTSFSMDIKPSQSLSRKVAFELKQGLSAKPADFRSITPDFRSMRRDAFRGKVDLDREFTRFGRTVKLMAKLPRQAAGAFRPSRQGLTVPDTGEFDPFSSILSPARKVPTSSEIRQLLKRFYSPAPSGDQKIRQWYTREKEGRAILEHVFTPGERFSWEQSAVKQWTKK